MKIVRILPSIALLLVASAAVAAPPQDAPRERVVIRGLQGIDHGSDWLTHLRRGFLGVQLTQITPELREHFGASRDSGVLVSSVADDSPAARAGMRVGDVLTHVGGQKVYSYVDVVRSLGERKEGDQVEIRVVRHGAPITMNATVEERDRRVVTLNRLPDNVRFFEGESAEKLREFFEGQEWQNRVFRIQDCADSQERLKALENRLRELEQRIR